jgi:hypothetical protein
MMSYAVSYAAGFSGQVEDDVHAARDLYAGAELEQVSLNEFDCTEE